MNLKCSYAIAMRSIALMAFLALQLCIFTCEVDSYAYAMDSDLSHMTEKLPAENNSDEQNSIDCGCYTSNKLPVFDAECVGQVPEMYKTQYGALTELNLKTLPFLIEYPPKTQHC